MLGAVGQRVGANLLMSEQVGESLLGGVHVGEHALHAGTSFTTVMVEQDGFLDAGERVEQFTHG